MPPSMNQTAADCLDVLGHIEAAGYTPVSFGRLAELTGHSKQKLGRELATLEAKQRVERTEAGSYLVARDPIFRLARCLANVRGQRIDLQEMESMIAVAMSVTIPQDAPPKEA